MSAPSAPSAHVINHLRTNPGETILHDGYQFRWNEDRGTLEYRPDPVAARWPGMPEVDDLPSVLESLTVNIVSPLDATDLSDDERFEDLLPLPGPAVNCECGGEDLYDDEAPLSLPVMTFDEDVTRENRRRLGYW